MGEDSNFSGGRLLNTVEKMERQETEELESPFNDRNESKKELLNYKQYMTANDFEISNRSSIRGFNDLEADEISRMINESYLDQNDTRN